MSKFNAIKLKKMIILSAIIVVVIIIMMIILMQKQEKQEEELNVGDIFVDFDEKGEKEPVQSHSMFFSVGEAVQNYLNAISLNTEEITPTPVPGTKMRSAATIYAENQEITDEETKKKAIYNYLEEGYIKENGITQENILEKITNYGDIEFEPLEMFELEGENITQFSVYGKETQVKTNKVRYVYFVVNVDQKNKVFNIKPIEENKYEKVEDIPLNAEDKSIEDKGNNYFDLKVLEYSDVAQKYFTYYKNLMLTDSVKAYEMLDESYRNKRFGSLEEYQRYIENNKEELETYLAKEYAVNNYEESTQYVCKDQYQNQYLFDVTSVMNFSVKLDTYTVESEEVKEEYKIAKDEKKVKMNIDKWILMLNNRDYKSAYEVLDEDFKNANFQTLESFEEYMKGIFPLHYGLTFSDLTEEGGVFVQEILLTDITAVEKSVTPETIIMKLTDDGFRMSFRILNR